MSQSWKLFSRMQWRRTAHQSVFRQRYATEVELPPDPGIMADLPPPQMSEYKPIEDKTSIIKTYKPRTPGLRHLRRPVHDHLYKGRPHLPLTIPRKGHGIGGRNNTGLITVRHRGGGHKRRIRQVDFDRFESGKWFVERIEHDPGRSAHIALISRPKQRKDEDEDSRYSAHLKSPIDAVTRVTDLPHGRDYRYIIATNGMRAGEQVESFRKGVPQKLLDSLGSSADAGMIAAKTAIRGNCLPLHMVPPGTMVHNIGLTRGKGGQLCRSAGTFGMVVNPNEHGVGKNVFAQVKLQSGEVRLIHREACATVGIVSNVNHSRAQLGKAGRKRWLGIRPTVRGVAMNACDHPHGGGRGKSKGNRHPVSPWGQLTKGGFKTRKRSKSTKHVITPRPRSIGPRSKAKQNKK